MRKRIGLFIITCIDVAIVLLGGWKLVPMKFNGKTVWEWERDHEIGGCEYHYRRPLSQASRTQETIWRRTEK